MDIIKDFNFGNGVKATIYRRSRDTRNGFAHDCVIPSLGVKATCFYYNRSWEKWDGESVIHNAFEKYLKGSCGLGGRKNEKAFNKAYSTLTKRLDMWHSKGKVKYQREPADIFG